MTAGALLRFFLVRAVASVGPRDYPGSGFFPVGACACASAAWPPVEKIRITNLLPTLG